MNLLNKIKITKSIILALALSLVFLISACSTSQGKYDNLAKCLTEKGATMYGTEWCSHCQNQKAAFGRSFQYIDFIDCDLERDKCQEAGVTGYPTWIIDGKSYSGEQPMYKLASLTECSLE